MRVLVVEDFPMLRQSIVLGLDARRRRDCGDVTFSVSLTIPARRDS